MLDFFALVLDKRYSTHFLEAYSSAHFRMHWRCIKFSSSRYRHYSIRYSMYAVLVSEVAALDIIFELCAPIHILSTLVINVVQIKATDHTTPTSHPAHRSSGSAARRSILPRFQYFMDPLRFNLNSSRVIELAEALSSSIK